MSLKKIITFFVSMILIKPGLLFSQFILPEDAYTTHRDRDVVRMDTEKIEVRGLKSRKAEGRSGKVELTWTLVDKSSQLALLRGEEAISNLTSMQIAKVVTLLEPGTSSYTDTVLNPGGYYYAIVTYKNLTDQTAILKTNDNYTAAPVTFGKGDLSRTENIADQFVSGIKAETIDNRTIRIRWSYDYIQDVSLLIYRSPMPVTDEVKLKTALRIGTVLSNKNYFDDEDGASGDFYYAVIVQDSFSVEKLIFKEGQNYTTKPVRKAEIKSMPVKSLNGFKYENDITLTWDDPMPQVTDQYIIYRSFQPIMVESNLENATIVERVSKNNFKFIDKGVSDGEFYYAVLTQNSEGTVQKSIIPGENSMIKPVKILSSKEKEDKNKEVNGTSEKKQTEIFPDLPDKSDIQKMSKDRPLIYDVNAVPERDRIHISWKPDRDIFNKIAKDSSFYHLFRFKVKPVHIGDLSPANYIAKIPIVNDSYYDNPPLEGLYYYALFITSSKGLLPSELMYGDNLVGPVIFKKSVKTVSEKDGLKETEDAREFQTRDKDFLYFDETSRLGIIKLNEILRRTFLQKNYSGTIRELESFKRSNSGEIRAKANFYIAISNYYTGNYDEAMSHMMDSSVRMHYKDRADFWYKQILEKMSQ
jgi:hypothetical protein